MTIKWFGAILITLQLVNITLTAGAIYFMANYLITQVR